jgi:hypothetical protein
MSEPHIMLAFFTEHFNLAHEPANKSLSGLLGFTNGSILFSDMHQYVLRRLNGPHSVSQETVHGIDTWWNLLTPSEKEEWKVLAAKVKPIYQELNRLSSVPQILEVQVAWVRSEVRKILVEMRAPQKIHEPVTREPIVSQYFLENLVSSSP